MNFINFLGQNVLIPSFQNVWIILFANNIYWKILEQFDTLKLDIVQKSLWILSPQCIYSYTTDTSRPKCVNSFCE